jgi:DNA polymerase-3 subunit alpha (Gram-positive type)
LDNGAQGIPEFGTPFVMGMLNATKPKTFGELVIISGLSHGTNVWRGNAEALINEGKATLTDVIGCRDDIMTYLIEQGVPAKTAFAIMEEVRRGHKVKPEFVKVMKACNVPNYYIDSCNAIAYLFPKAHATAYVTMAVRVAWFKVHHPLAYYASFFSLRAKQFDLETMIKKPQDILARIDQLRIEATKRRGKLKPKEEDTLYTLQMALEMVERGFKITNIDIDRSDAGMFLIDNESNSLIPPFIVLDGIGLNAANSVLAAREEKPFLSRSDLLSRTKLSATNIDDLAKLGALDHLDESNQISLFSFDGY